MNPARLSLDRKTVTLVLTLAMAVGGLFSFLGMSRLEDPEFTIKEALVITSYPGATPAEVADEVTDVIEGAAQQLSQLKNVTSLNSPGRSIVTVEIQDTFDKETLPQVWDELRRKVSDAQAELPPGAGPSLVVDDFNDVYGILLAVTGDGYSQRDLRDFAVFLRKQLLLVDDVAKVAIWGEQQETVYVEISRARMDRLGLSLESLCRTLGRRNLAVPAGNIRIGREYVEISPTGGVESVQGLGDLLVKDAGRGKVTPLRDVAAITRGYEDPPVRIMRFNGAPAVALGVSVVSGGNVVDLGRAVNARLEALKNRTPVGMAVTPVYFQPERVEGAVNSFALNLAGAVAIVIAVLLVFMGVQSGLLIGSVLLITILGSFIFIQMAGVALERISLGALIISLGMLVDNAIVVVEGVLVRYRQGMDRRRAAVDVVRQTQWPLLGATIVAVMAFAGIGLSEDVVGEYCRSLFVVLFISLMMSWITAVTVTPVMCHMFLKPKVRQEKDPYGGFLFTAYRSLLGFCLRHRLGVALLLVSMLAGSVYGFGFVNQSFFPESTQPRFFIHFWMPQGTDVRDTAAAMAEVEDMLMDDDRVVSATSFAGEGAPRFILTYAPEKTNTSYGLVLVQVKDFELIDDMMAAYKERFARDFPDAEPKLKRFRLGPGRDASIEARFSGPDTKVLRRLSREAREIMLRSGRAESIRDDWRQEVKVVRPVLSEAQAKLAGLTRPDVAEALEASFNGRRVGVYREGDTLMPIIVRPPEDERLKIDQIGNVRVFSPVAGRMIPLEEVVSDFATGMEYGLLKTRNRLLTVTASCEPVSGLPSMLFNELRPKIEAMELPPGYVLEWGGEYEDSRDAQTSLAKSLPVPFIIMILVTVMLFNCLRIPLIIWLTVPLAVIGVTIGLLGTGESFGFMALLGFLSLSGMLIKNAVVLLDQIKLELKSGKAPQQAVMDAAVSRIRPVAMAAATTILGMAPLVADPFFSAMAVTIMSGLAFATLLTLFVVPTLYTLFYRISCRGSETGAD